MSLFTRSKGSTKINMLIRNIIFRNLSMSIAIISNNFISYANIFESVVSWITDTGSKGYPLFWFGTGREGV